MGRYKMPIVGNKHFKYSPEGMKAALALAEKTGQKVRVDRKGLGGMVKQYQKGGMLKGKSHKQGGIPAVVGGKEPIEMEGGEYIIKKKSVDKLGKGTLDHINQTGRLPQMEDGGAVENPYLREAQDVYSQLEGGSFLTKGKQLRRLSELMGGNIGIDAGAGNMSLFGALRNLGHIRSVQNLIKTANKSPDLLKLTKLGAEEIFETSKKRKEAKKKLGIKQEGGIIEEVNPYIERIKQSQQEYENFVPRSYMPNKHMSQRANWDAESLHNRMQDTLRGNILSATRRNIREEDEASSVSGSSPMSLFGALKARGHRRAALRL